MSHRNPSNASELEATQNNDYSVFIRRRGPGGWTRGRPHHQQALLLFQQEERQGQGERQEQERQICVPHTDGGDFVAWFRRLNHMVYQYRDEYGSLVDIMMSSSGHAGYINRIIDHF